MSNAPILVTGSHRSGTTWTGKTLAASQQLAYVHEPLNPKRSPGWAGNRIPYWYLYICRDNERYYRDVFERVMALRYPIKDNLTEVRGLRQLALFASDAPRSLVYRARSLRPLVKDPLALFSAEWLAEAFGMQVVVLIRHPAGFASSLKRLNWQFKFRSWLAQDLLMRDWLGPFQRQMHDYWVRDVDVVDQAILMWNAIHHVIREFQTRHPTWIFLRYEDLARAPRERFRTLYDRLALRWGTGVERAIARNSAAGNPREVAWWRHQSVRRASTDAAATWRYRLTEEEQARVRAGVGEVASSFYDAEDWSEQLRS